MIAAYHAVVPEDSLSGILAKGAILPASMYHPRRYLKKQCIKWFDKDISGRDFATPSGLDALKLLLLEKTDEFPDVDVRVQPTTAFRCWEFLADDHHRVFLKPWGWPYDMLDDEWQPTGLVFDTEELIRRGARVRKHDLWRTYRPLLDLLLGKNWKTPEEGASYFQSLVGQLHAEEEVSGEMAIPFLHEAAKGASRGQAEYAFVEVVWDGPLPVDLAIEIWRNGRLI